MLPWELDVMTSLLSNYMEKKEMETENKGRRPKGINKKKINRADGLTAFFLNWWITDKETKKTLESIDTTLKKF